MKRVLIALLAITSLGFIIETPESIRLQRKQEQSWQKKVKRTYDLPALHSFLVSQISSVASVEEVDLRTSKVDTGWQPAGLAFRSGHWVFSPNDVKAPEFTLSWAYEQLDRGDQTGLEKTITLVCRRHSKSAFALVRAYRHEDEYVILMP